MLIHQCVFLLTLLSLVKLVISRTRHVVYWDRSINSSLTTELRLQVKINEWMDILCPKPARNDRKRGEELYIDVFNVTAAQYHRCTTQKIQRVLRCSDPRKEIKLTTKFQERSPSPLGFVFRPGQSYYYLSKPSKGGTRGCSTDTLRLVVEVESQHGRVEANKHTRFDPWLDQSEFGMKHNKRHHHLKNAENVSEQRESQEPVVLSQKNSAAPPDGGNSAVGIHLRRHDTRLLALITSSLLVVLFTKWV
ncbi:ephrin [Ciona intestinalis]